MPNEKMRTRDRISAIKAATDDDGNIVIETEEVTGGAEIHVKNWGVLSKALSLLSDPPIFETTTEEEDESIQALIARFPMDRPLYMSTDQFSIWEDNITNYASELSKIIWALESFFPDSIRDDEDDNGEDDNGDDERFEFAVELNVGETGSIDDVQDKLNAVLNVYGQFMSLDGQVRVKGFESGSDWLVLEAATALQADFIIYMLACMGDIVNSMSPFVRETVRLTAELIRAKSTPTDTPSSTSPHEEDVLQDFYSFIRDRKVDEYIEKLKEKYPNDEAILNEGRNRGQKSVDILTALHSQGVTFQIPERVPTEINITINGDNNTIELPQIEPTALPASTRTETPNPFSKDPAE